MNSHESSVFERHPKTTLLFIWLIPLGIFLILAEVMLQRSSGLGHPVLFFEQPSFGYRLQPNQETYRFGGAHFKINNLGLRANQDWDSDVEDKVLFLGDSVTYGGNHISNEELFSEIALNKLDDFQSGNVGMPNYGVENVYGLVVEDQFLPARIYVSTFIEADFYRGLVLAENRPWILTEAPRFALEELARWLWFRYIGNTRESNRRETERVPESVRRENAVKKLKEMDEFLKAKDFLHIIFISPSRMQILGREQIDFDLKSVLDEQEVQVVYLLEKLTLSEASEDDRMAWYQDCYHLTTQGHQVWGELIQEGLEKLDLTP